EHVVGFEVRQMDRQQMQTLVDRADQAELGQQPVHREQATEPGYLDIAADLIVDLPGGHHGRELDTPMPSQRMPGLDLTATARRVPPTPCLRYLLHRKGLSCRAALRAQSQTR